MPLSNDDPLFKAIVEAMGRAIAPNAPDLLPPNAEAETKVNLDSASQHLRSCALETELRREKARS